MAVNKIIYGSDVLLDLTGDTVDPESLAKGITAHDKSGEPIVGTSTKDSDTSDADVTVAEILEGKTAYARGAKITGTMPSYSGTRIYDIGKISQTVNIPLGFHDGSGIVRIAPTQIAKMKPENIREGVTILGVTGTMSGSEGENPQDNINVTPTKEEQIIIPDEGYTCLRQVTVKAIPYTETPNAAGGTTVTIG